MGLRTSDDAAVYRINDDTAIVQTVDIFPPIVDDPFKFGEIALTNAVSDVYAMGGKPLLGLNIVGFPSDIPKEILGEILKGGSSKASEAGVLIVGGHTIVDAEPKYGLSITGVLKPGQQITNAEAKPGDILVLTKPIGTGIITTAAKQGQVDKEIFSEALKVMTTLNYAASCAMINVGVNACVDITGYGLVGHLLSLLKASKVCARLNIGSVPKFDGVMELIQKDIVSGGTRRNLDSAERFIYYDQNIDSQNKILLSDAQTSGGLLISVSPDKINDLMSELENHGVSTKALIGEVLPPNSLNGPLLYIAG